MKKYLVTMEYTVVYTKKYEVEAEDNDQALEIVQDGDLDTIFEDDEVVFSDCDVEEIS
jgi:hypothetical protein